MSECDHIIGHVEPSYDCGGNLRHVRNESELYARWSPPWRDLDTRFDFCPRCGTAFDWEKIQAEQKRMAAEADALDVARDAAKEASAKKSAAARLYNERMRGADAESW